MRTIDVLRLAALSGLLTDPTAAPQPARPAPADGGESFADVLASLPGGPGAKTAAVPPAQAEAAGAPAPRAEEPQAAEAATTPAAIATQPAPDGAAPDDAAPVDAAVPQAEPHAAEVATKPALAADATELPAVEEDDASAPVPQESGATGAHTEGGHRFEAPIHYESLPAPQGAAAPAAPTATPAVKIAAPAAPAPLLQQVQAALRPEGGTVRLRLEPPELGTVLIEVRLAGSTVSARLEADRADTAAALAEGLPLLRHALATDGVRIERFEITAREAPAGAPSPTDADGGAAADQGRERERAPAPPPPHPLSPLRPNPTPTRAEARPAGVALLDAWA